MRLAGLRCSLKSLVTRDARSVFGALPWRVARIDTLHRQRHLQPRAQRSAVLLEAVGRGLQTVVHMDGPHLAWPARGAGQQQGGGVGAAAQAHGQRQRGRKGAQRGVEGLGHGSAPASVAGFQRLSALVSVKRP